MAVAWLSIVVIEPVAGPPNETPEGKFSDNRDITERCHAAPLGLGCGPAIDAMIARL
jgi:hypothetical protein